MGRYVSNVLKHWTADALDGRFEGVTLYTPAPIDRTAIEVPETIEERVVGPHWRQLMWQNLRLAPAVRDDVLFCPSYSRPIIVRGKTVVTIFEATQKLHPELYPRQTRLVNSPLYGWGGRHATLVITATETGREDIATAYGIPKDRIRVVPLAPAEVFRRPAQDRDAEVLRALLGAGRPYFLFVGKLTARRNAPMLVEAFAELKRRASIPHALVMVGLNTTGVDLPELAAQLGVADAFRYVEYVGDDELATLFAGAEAFVMPYSYEALSLTALEAQASGTAVLTVDAPGLREQTGGHALFIERSEVRALVDAMDLLTRDTSIRGQLVEAGREHAARFTWQRCSLETLAVLEEAQRL